VLGTLLICPTFCTCRRTQAYYCDQVQEDGPSETCDNLIALRSPLAVFWTAWSQGIT